MTTKLNAILIIDPQFSKDFLVDILLKLDYELTILDNCFKAYDHINSNGCDLLICHYNVEDFKRSYLFPFLKAVDKTESIPLVLIADDKAESSDISSFLNIADLIIYENEFNDNPENSYSLIKDLIDESSQIQSVCPKNFLAASIKFKDDVMQSYQSLIVNLLTDKMVSKICKKFYRSSSDINSFIDNYFNDIENFINSSLTGLFIATSIEQKAIVKINDNYSQEQIREVINFANKSLDSDFDFNDTIIINNNEQATENKTFGETKLFKIETKSLGMMVFVFQSPKKFSKQENYIIENLKSPIEPICELILSKYLIEKLNLATQNLNSSIDQVSKAYSLEFLMGFLQQQLLFSSRNNLITGLVFIEIKNLIENLSVGEDYINDFLFKVANLITRSTRASDLLARYSINQFVIVTPNTGLSGLAFVRNKLKQSLNDLAKEFKFETPIEFVFGISQSNVEDTNPESILLNAKIEMSQNQIENS